MRRRLALPLLFILVVGLGGLGATFATGSSPELGLDLQGGVSVVLLPTNDASDEQLDVAVEVIRNRVDALGVAEPEIVRQGDAIEVQLPGVENRDRALELVGQTAELRFRPVLNAQETGGGGGQGGEGGEGGEGEAPAEGGEGGGETTTTTAAETTTTTAADATTTSEAAVGLMEGESAAGLAPRQPRQPQQEEPATTTTTAPAPTTPAPPETTDTTAPAEAAPPPPVTPPEEDREDAQVNLLDENGDVVYSLGPTLATGRVVESARAELGQQGTWQVALTMRGGENGIDRFNQAAATCNPPGELCPTGQLAIVLDSIVQSAPTINQASFQRDEIAITGAFSEGEAKDLALVLRYGSLPVELERQDVRTVSASLGEDSLRAGVIAGIVGLSLVALYMVLYYRALGLVVLVGMGVWGSLMYSVISWLGATQGLALTLAGVTGIIVSVGVTVDSYVVYFERLKDEVKAGRTLRTSTERAFRRAFRTILAADVSSFIGASVLWWLTVGSVRGFAFFLGLSTILDVVVAWFFTRPIVTMLSRNRMFTEAPVIGVARGLAAPSGPAVATAGATVAGVRAGSGRAGSGRGGRGGRGARGRGGGAGR